jgi:hypothetical protein
MNHYWRDSAACAGADPEMFLAETGGEAQAAKSVCAACPVRAACLEAALTEEKDNPAPARAGIRGGMSPKQRAALAKRRRGPVPQEARRRTGGKPLSPCGTPGAYERHRRWGEPVDEACRAAHNAKNRAVKAATRARAAGPVVCGTRGGYQKHRRNGEKPCDACRHANTAADRRLRTTGSTVAST